MAKFDMSEYQYSEYEKYMALRSNSKGLILNNSNCNVHFSNDGKTVRIFVDPYFAKHYEESEGRGPGVYTGEEILSHIEESKHKYEEDDVDDEPTSAEEELARLCKRFEIHFYDEVEEGEEIPKHYDHEYYANALSGSSIFYHLGEGILDFFYFDIEKHISSLQFMFALLSSKGKKLIAKMVDREEPNNEPIKIKNLDEKGEFIDQQWRITNEFCRDYFYSSLYTAIFTPVILDVEATSLSRYINYIKILQDEFKEKLTFCFDPDFYPSLLGHLYPAERYRLYNDLYSDGPSTHMRREKFSVHRRISGESEMPFGYNIELVKQRMALKIDTTSNEYREFEEKYCKKSKLVDVVLKIPSCIGVQYVCSSIYEMLELEFTKMLESNIRLRKCKRCGKYFIMKGNYDTNYCDRVADGQTRSCQDLAAQENYKAKAAENPALPIYSKYYKRYAARVRSRQIKEADFKKWKFQALAKRDECSDGKITVEEYIAWMESCFPNRTPKT